MDDGQWTMNNYEVLLSQGIICNSVLFTDYFCLFCDFESFI